MRELTSMQAACWVGRESTAALGNVAAHLYAEFDGPKLDPERLQVALDRLVLRHPMLRLRVDANGIQNIDNKYEKRLVSIEDLRDFQDESCRQRLDAKRQMWSGRKLDLSRGQAADFGLTLLPRGRCRLHVDTDMIAIDPRSFLIVMEDLARLYEAEHPDKIEIKNDTTSPPAYFVWLDRLKVDSALGQQRDRDRQWWRNRLAYIPPAPPLPLKAMDGTTPPRSDRLAAWLSPAERASLEGVARNQRITTSSLALGLFAAVLGAALKTAQFRLSVPMFWREPVIERVESIVGEFSNMVILGVDLTQANTLGQLCTQIAGQMMDLLAHSAYPGVSVMRDLSRHHGTMQSSPVVFTSGLGMPGGNLLSERVTRVFGKMDWVISQGAQVALDAQIAELDDGLLINWDIRREALPDSFIHSLFDAYVALLQRVAAQPEHMDATIEDGFTPTEKMLITLLQRLTPHGNHCADGNIAMIGPNEQAELRDFINRYVPHAALTDHDIVTHGTAHQLAKLLHSRSDGASCAIARVFLQTVDTAA
ncbi:hypothetical protein H4S14_000175 [Agrobacterium vitis]|nr:hypothetical protein [Agrobacterium vitis]MBE1436448.1 hypothetical protein [Agrobacterium vitis]